MNHWVFPAASFSLRDDSIQALVCNSLQFRPPSAVCWVLAQPSAWGNPFPDWEVEQHVVSLHWDELQLALDKAKHEPLIFIMVEPRSGEILKARNYLAIPTYEEPPVLCVLFAQDERQACTIVDVTLRVKKKLGPHAIAFGQTVVVGEPYFLTEDDPARQIGIMVQLSIMSSSNKTVLAVHLAQHFILATFTIGRTQQENAEPFLEKISD